MIWDIKPFVGMGPVLFGMTEQEVDALGLGPLTARRVDPDGTVNEHRGLGIPTVSYKNGTACYLAAGPDVNDVLWQSTNVWLEQPKAVIQALEAANGGAEVGLGNVWFKNLGIDTNGFYLQKNRRFFRAGHDQDDRVISMFDRDLSAKQAAEFAQFFQPISFVKR